MANGAERMEEAIPGSRQFSNEIDSLKVPATARRNSCSSICRKR